jgi:hypothetical protein
VVGGDGGLGDGHRGRSREGGGAREGRGSGRFLDGVGGAEAGAGGGYI